MKLLTKAIEKALPPLYATEKIPSDDKLVVAKFFTPDSGWTWYAIEYDPGERLFFGLVQGQETALGYFSLDELESATGPMGLHIERDIHFRPTKLGALKQQGLGCSCGLSGKRYVLVEWTDQDGRYHGGNHLEADLPKLYATLKAQGVRKVYVEDEEVDLQGQLSATQALPYRKWPEFARYAIKEAARYYYNAMNEPHAVPEAAIAKALDWADYLIEQGMDREDAAAEEWYDQYGHGRFDQEIRNAIVDTYKRLRKAEAGR
jgi:hypothetical protein